MSISTPPLWPRRGARAAPARIKPRRPRRALVIGLPPSDLLASCVKCGSDDPQVARKLGIVVSIRRLDPA